eukprot:m.132916 g.132916  ORF g.132916 m.132916 type:complete len:563 (+) comp16499_c0_seq1:221-1909(+)
MSSGDEGEGSSPIPSDRHLHLAQPPAPPPSDDSAPGSEDDDDERRDVLQDDGAIEITVKIKAVSLNNSNSRLDRYKQKAHEQTTTQRRKAQHASETSRRHQLRQEAMELSRGMRDSSTQMEENPFAESVVQLYTCDDSVALQILTDIRRRLSAFNSPVSSAIDAGLLRAMTRWLMRFDLGDLQCECLYILGSVAASKIAHTLAVIESGMIPTLISMLESTNRTVRTQACWILGNIAGDAPAHRNVILYLGAAMQFARLMQETTDVHDYRETMWAASSLCRGVPLPDPECVMPMIPHLIKAATSPDSEICSYAAWSLAHLVSSPGSSFIDILLQHGAAKVLVDLLLEGRAGWPALQALGGIALGTAQQQEAMMTDDFWRIIKETAFHSKRMTREAMFVLTNIAEGPKFEELFRQGIVDLLLMPRAEHDDAVYKEMMWIVRHLLNHRVFQYTQLLVKMGCVEFFVPAIFFTDEVSVRLYIESVQSLAHVGWNLTSGSENPYEALVMNTLYKVIQEHLNREQLDERSRGRLEQAKLQLQACFTPPLAAQANILLHGLPHHCEVEG